MPTRRSGSSDRSPLALAGATIVLPRRAHETLRLAAGELARYLYLLTGRVSPLTERLPERGVAVVLDRKMAAACGVTAPKADQSYRLAVVRQGKVDCLCLAAAQPVGVLYGVYGLLEELGMGFYAGGDTFPELPAPATVPANLDRTDAPAFKMRGNMLHYNFLCGPTDWGLEDYKFYFDQLARMRCNVLLMHWYDSEPGAAYEVDGEYRAGGVTPNSLTRPWGALESLRTSQYYFDTGRYFDAEIFSSPAGEDLPDLLTEVKRSEEMWREATRYARTAGIYVAAGFEEPRGDPTDPQTVAHFRERVRQFLARNPHISHFALWQHESGGCTGSQPPAPGTPAAALHREQHELFAYLGNERRVWEAIRYGRFAAIAAEVLAEERPGMPMVVVGWGGDRWMRFADYCLGYDKLLPPNVIFTCHDNIDASFGPNVSTPWGELPPERERWAMPWVEGDIDDCWVRQPHVESLGNLAPDALRKGCQGLLTLQWRTRDVEEETGYIAQFAWDTSLTPDKFYRRKARHEFGPDQEVSMGKVLGTLQRLGARWTGVRGAAECSGMRWTGWVPHLPFEVEEAVEHLLPKAEKIVEMLSEVPPADEDAEAGAFHLRGVGEKLKGIKHDPRRFGVAEMKEQVKRLRALGGEKDRKRLRQGLREVEEAVYALRAPLVAYGMSSRSYQAIDGFLIAIHHLQRNAGASWKMPLLRKLRSQLERLRKQYLREGRLARLERLDFLAATMDFALGYDSTVLLVADGELTDQALAAAAKARDQGKLKQAAKLAAQAYDAVREAGMQNALEAYTRKLTTRCDFGVLTTLNVKPMPLYWRTLAALEEFLPAAPPRQVQARGKAEEAWVSWEPFGKCAAQNLYRRRAGKEWEKVSATPLAADCRMFLDRPRPGVYEYAVTALAENGWESPRSHVGRATVGALDPPRIVACKPCSRAQVGEDLPVRVTVVSDREVDTVAVFFRTAGEPDWHWTPLQRRFRESWQGVIPGEDVKAGTLEYFVAGFAEGAIATWPETGDLLPWSMTVV